MCRAAPETGVIRFAGFIDDRGCVEYRIDRRRVGRIGRTVVIDDALKLLGIGHPPVGKAREFEICAIGERGFPVQPLAAVCLHPDQPRRTNHYPLHSRTVANVPQTWQNLPYRRPSLRQDRKSTYRKGVPEEVRQGVALSFR